MIDLDTEKATLAKAERDIAEGEERITRQQALIEHLRRGGHATAAAEALLATLRQTLLAWQEHREAILDTIARLEAERAGPAGGR